MASADMHCPYSVSTPNAFKNKLFHRRVLTIVFINGELTNKIYIKPSLPSEKPVYLNKERDTKLLE